MNQRAKLQPPTLDQIGLAEIQRSRVVIEAFEALATTLLRGLKVDIGGNRPLSHDAVVEWHRKWLEQEAADLEAEAERLEHEARMIRQRRRA